jgi:hypothetical protein
MLKNKLSIALAIAVCSTTAMADEEVSYSFGLKNWNHKFTEGGNSTSATTATILSATAKKGNYLVTVSTVLPTTYSFPGGSNLIRKDTDIALGYVLNSNLSLIAGVKKLPYSQYSDSDDTTSNYTINMSYLGLNGFSAIGEQSFVYGTALRSLRAKEASATTNMTFTSVELGLGYVLNKNTQLTAGYRSQKFSDDTSTTLPGVIFGVNITP